MSDAVPTTRSGRVRDLVRSAHPKQAVFLAAVAVLVVQLSLGLSNDLSDQRHDYRAQTPGKPIAAGLLAPTIASYCLMDQFVHELQVSE